MQLYVSTSSDRIISSDDASSVVSGSSSSRCCCHGDHLLASVADGDCDSGLSSGLSDAAAALRIAEMEAELAQLRQQLALIVIAQERSSQPGELIV